jgi:hypothetical protein
MGYKNPLRTSQEAHYISAKELGRLMLCKIWGFHISDYEECRLMGYKNPVHTTQETHYLSATEPSQFMQEFTVFTAVTQKNAVFLEVIMRDSFMNRRLGGTYHFHQPIEKSRAASVTSYC